MPVPTEEFYRLINKENDKIEKFRKANPQFKVDDSNIASSIEEAEHFEHIYAHMGIRCF